VRTVSASLPVATIVTHTYSWAALALILAAIVARQSPPSLSNTQAWSGIFAMALVSQLFGHTGMNAALKWFSPNAVGFSTVIEPVIGAVLAWVFLGESLSAKGIVGAVIALGSIAIVLREERSEAA